MMNNIKRNGDFFKSILRESNRHRRMEKLLHANKDQINSVSKFTLNMLKKKIPLPPLILAKLTKHKSVLREKSRIKRLKMTKPQSRAGQTQETLKRKKPITKRRPQRGGGFNIQKWISKLGIEFHWPGYQYIGPGTKLAKRLKRGDPGINQLDKLAKQHDIDYTNAKSLAEKHRADRIMVAGINNFKGKKSWTEEIVKRTIPAKLGLNLQ